MRIPTRLRSRRPVRPCIAALSAIVLAGTVAACEGGDAPSAPPTVTPLATYFPRPTPDPNVTAPAEQAPAPAAARVVTRGGMSRRAVALTFEAGTDAGNTEEILRILRNQRIRATFAVTGVWAERHRDLLFAISVDGHEIMNNTYDHRSFTGVSTNEPPLNAQERALELSRTEVTVYRYTSQSTKPYFRPPYGDYDDTVRRDAAANGYDTIIMWTVDTLGWSGATAADISARVLTATEPGAIIAMSTTAESQDADALLQIVATLEADNYAFQTISEILQD